MFAATYIRGSANFNAVALHYGIMRETGFYGAGVPSSTPEASISAPLLTSALALLLPVVLGLGRSLARDNTLEATMPNTAEILVDTFRRPCVTGFRSSFW